MTQAAFTPLIGHLWQSTLFAVVAGLMTLALRRNRARVRYWLWLAASYKFLVPFSLIVSIGGIFKWDTAAGRMPTAVAHFSDAVTAPLFLTSLLAGGGATGNSHPEMVPLLVWSVWACGATLVFAGWFREWLRMRSVVRAASPLNLGLPIRLVSTSARLEPGVFGVFRPTLVLPEGIAGRLTEQQLRAVLAHELCHVRRRDNLAATVHMIVEALFWFYPLVWWLERRIIEEREHVCDEEVLAAGGQAQIYAESILKVCELYLESPLTCLSGVLGSDLRKRIERIMLNRLGNPMSGWQKALLITAGALAVALPIGAGVLALPTLWAQSSADNSAKRQSLEAMEAAGVRMSFDAASVKPNNSGSRSTNNVGGLFHGAVYSSTGGLFSATSTPLISYIIFAYDLPSNQIVHLIPQLPKWTNTEMFDIQARAEGNPTREQMQLMMQFLLADRFKLVVHTETKEAPVYALALVKPGKTGPGLQPDNKPCPSEPTPPVSGAPPPAPPRGLTPEFPTVCGFSGMQASRPGRFRAGGRHITVEDLARLITGGLRGLIDRWSTERGSPAPMTTASNMCP